MTQLHFSYTLLNSHSAKATGGREVLEFMVEYKFLFSGVVAAIVTGVFALAGRSKNSPARSEDKGGTDASGGNSQVININNSLSVNGKHPETTTSSEKQPGFNTAPHHKTEEQIRRIKDSTRIVFVDDDERFKVVKILKNSGWCNTSLVKDVGSLDDRAIFEADIFFVDIQGVGIKLGFKDEGLGLAAALKVKYPEKKLVIYSAEPKGERFHKALRMADDSLEKNADPYEFQLLVEQFAGLS